MRAPCSWPLLTYFLLVAILIGFSAGVEMRAARAGAGRPSEHYAAFFAQLPSMAGKTVVVTGASRGLGYVTALSCAKLGAEVYLLSRSSAWAEQARDDIAAASTGPAPQLVPCDLNRFESVAEAAATVRRRAAGGVDVLCLNAGIMLQPDEASADGFDITIQTNVLSHFLLVRELLPSLEAAAAARGEARVVSMSSSSGFGPPALDRRFFLRNGGRMGGEQASYERYHQSKLANLLFASELDARLRRKGSALKALACTPGVCGTDMFAHVMQLSGRPVDLSRVPSVEDGSLGQLKCICDPKAQSGELFGPKGMGGPPVQIPLGKPTVLVDEEARATLWEVCEQAVGKFEV